MRYVYAVVILLCLLMLGALQVRAHSWYPIECCHQMDCAPVNSMSYVASSPTELPSMVVSTKHGTVMVPRNFPIKPSQDGQTHACIRNDDKGAPKLICLFLPPSL